VAHDFSNFFAQDRPFFGYVYQIFVPIFKDSQLDGNFLLFFLTPFVICFWWLLRKMIPNKNRLALMAAMFFAVYQGFQMHCLLLCTAGIRVAGCLFFVLCYDDRIA
jgi:hypothetical protein